MPWRVWAVIALAGAAGVALGLAAAGGLAWPGSRAENVLGGASAALLRFWAGLLLALGSPFAALTAAAVRGPWLGALVLLGAAGASAAVAATLALTARAPYSQPERLKPRYSTMQAAPMPASASG